MELPIDYAGLKTQWEEQPEYMLDPYLNKKHSFLPFLLPEEAVKMDDELVLQLLAQRFGSSALQDALNPSVVIPSPLKEHSDPNWLKTVNMVGINIRTIGGYWEVIKYALTLPDAQSAIHLLPIWEPGVVSSLYGMASWNLNPEFFSEKLNQINGQLDTVEKQLKVCINLLHLMGKSVGLDVIPHTDRYSEIVLANPSFFEWLWRRGDTIVDHRANLHQEVEKSIHAFLVDQGPAVAILGPTPTVEEFFNKLSEDVRLRWLFGDVYEYEGRQNRRIKLVDFLFKLGFEPVPATMGPPYRGLKVSTKPEARTTDNAGRVWVDYEITQPQPMSRVFGPLTRYKLYERKQDNRDWQIDFTLPRKRVWAYLLDKFAAFCQKYPFDFMRGDMSHVQMRPEGVPTHPDSYYDIHQALRQHIRQQRPWFGYFAESFLAPPNTMAYGDETDHLEASEAESTLGDLQSMVVGSPEFMKNFSWYVKLGATRKFAPNFTLMTADKDDPRFDRFYLAGNEARFFISMFLTNLPSYMGLGFECRAPHHLPVPNEHYTKLYVFHLDDGPKSTKGPYIWGRNGQLFYQINRIRLEAEKLLPELQNQEVEWIWPPAENNKLIAWTHGPDQKRLFVVNLDLSVPQMSKKIAWGDGGNIMCRFSTHRQQEIRVNKATEAGLPIPDMLPGECIILEK
ncbi:MAG: hypothetical protein KDC34_10200 [Saprospiraceae bacterium]|nr:hypothetical protein [Saprospiraceae bacterium]